ncbi:hypothetical protein EVAR_100650_1 [Eumeta japonica]|uniref:Uncharacterized protein n=1 Tax=Eumeta variegata TaxID=151549 RepID=A0A4C1SJ05_EUMVA|nr:hypothetical protein EVAR_100650_1 [Eumeta japonica]
MRPSAQAQDGTAAEMSANPTMNNANIPVTGLGRARLEPAPHLIASIIKRKIFTTAVVFVASDLHVPAATSTAPCAKQFEEGRQRQKSKDVNKSRKQSLREVPLPSCHPHIPLGHLSRSKGIYECI